MNDKQELVVSQQSGNALAAWGASSDLELLANRFLLFFDVEEKDRAAARPAALKAGQLTLRYGMTPGVHLFIVKRGGRWGAEETLEAWKTAADKHAFLGRFRYDVQFREMTTQEVRDNTPADAHYTPNDKGFFARVLRYDLAREAKELGLPYDPPWVTGFWRKEAYEEKVWQDGKGTSKGRYVGTGRWQPDTVPAQRTTIDVARRRAHRAALKAVFTLIQLDDFEQRAGSVERAEQWRLMQAMSHISGEIEERARIERDETDPLINSTFVEKPIRYEADGDVLWATEHRGPVVTVATSEPIQAVRSPSAPRWPSAAAAYDWAVESGACKNEHEAKASMKKIIDAQFDGKLTRDNMAAVFEAFHARQMEKLHEQAEAAVQDATELDPDGLTIPA